MGASGKPSFSTTRQLENATYRGGEELEGRAYPNTSGLERRVTFEEDEDREITGPGCGRSSQLRDSSDLDHVSQPGSARLGNDGLVTAERRAGCMTSRISVAASASPVAPTVSVTGLGGL